MWACFASSAGGVDGSAMACSAVVICSASPGSVGAATGSPGLGGGGSGSLAGLPVTIVVVLAALEAVVVGASVVVLVASAVDVVVDEARPAVATWSLSPPASSVFVPTNPISG